MGLIQKLFDPNQDARVEVTILSPKATIVNTIVIIFYSGILLDIYKNISFTPENSIILAGSILTLIVVAAICISAVSSYIHYIKYTKPLLDLAHAAGEVAAGNYKVQLPPHRRDGKLDEIDVLYQDFNTMVRELDSTEMLKNSFISNISHELKTPIAIISNYAALLVKDNLSAKEKQEYLEKIKNTVSDLSELITNILQISKLDNNQIKTNIVRFDYCEELIQCILARETVLDDKNIDLQLEIPDELYIESDLGLLKIVINNILSNAIKFTPDSGTITIRLNEEERFASLTITDNGCGMDENTIRHIFDKFYQADTSHKTKGNGLGLAMVRQIVNLLNGNIEVTSKLGEGSTFKVSLPKCKS